MSNCHPEIRLKNCELYLAELLLTKSTDEEIFEAWEDVKHWRKVVKNIELYEKGLFEVEGL
jgi:hypothetical protein